MEKRAFLFIVIICALSCRAPSQVTTGAQPSPAPTPASLELSASEAASGPSVPRVVKVVLTITSPSDLKVKQGERIERGAVLSDRSLDRRRLLLQQKQIKLQLQHLDTIRLDKSLPPVSFAAQQAAIARAQVDLAIKQHAVTVQQARLSEIARLSKPQPLVRDHESARLELVDLERQQAASQLEVERARLQSAREERAFTEQQRMLELDAKRLQVELMKTQLQTRLAEIEEKLQLLSEVRAPFSGIVKRVQWEEQRDHNIILVLLIAVDGAGREAGH
jgi:hypothetical protein